MRTAIRAVVHDRESASNETMMVEVEEEWALSWSIPSSRRDSLNVAAAELLAHEALGLDDVDVVEDVVAVATSEDDDLVAEPVGRVPSTSARRLAAQLPHAPRHARCRDARKPAVNAVACTINAPAHASCVCVCMHAHARTNVENVEVAEHLGAIVAAEHVESTSWRSEYHHSPALASQHSRTWS